jgi:phosphonopyruvate decarboxylase
MQIPYAILSTEEAEAEKQLSDAILDIKKSNAAYALVIRSGTFAKYSIKEGVKTQYELSREDAIKIVVDQLQGNEIIVSTTGKTSRELFECRVAKMQPHHSDFLTVGSMGHSSQIALGIALSKPHKKVICLDGDGALLMHMGGMAIIGNQSPANFIHIVLNNGSHESVGGQPTVALSVDIPAIAKANNYKYAVSLSSESDLKAAFKSLSAEKCPALIEVKVRTGSRDDLGRPTTKPVENKISFMQNLQQ